MWITLLTHLWRRLRQIWNAPEYSKEELPDTDGTGHGNDPEKESAILRTRERGFGQQTSETASGASTYRHSHATYKQFASPSCSLSVTCR